MDKNLLSKKVFQDPCYFIAFGFGSGLLPYAPGTWGTVAGILLYMLWPISSLWVYLAFLLIIFAIGVVVSEKVTQDLGEQDYPGIVWDEVVGYWVTMFAVPRSWIWMGLGFVLFRMLDIWKPRPIRDIDAHLHGGWGIMLDDVLAGVMACVIMHLIVWSVSL